MENKATAKQGIADDGDNQSDLARMWQEASIEYYTIIKVPIKKNSGLTSSKWREYGGPIAGEKVAKLRHLIASNSEFILKGADFIKDAASAAFPPSAAILTGLTYVLKASKNISQDYDNIQTFFEDLQQFLERLSIIEKCVPRFEGYRLQLMRVFTAIMNLLALATKATAQGRLKRFGKAMFHGGGDDELAGARTKLDTTLSRLESATNFANLEVGYQNLDMAGEIKQDTGDIRDGQKVITEKFEVLFESYSSMAGKWDQYMMAQRRGKDELAHAADSTIAGRKPSALQTVQRELAGEDDPTIVERELEYAFVEGTSTWLFEQQEFISWRDGTSQNSILWVTGEKGMGKSTLAYSAMQELGKSTASEAKTFVVRYYCREGLARNTDAMLGGAFKSAVYQISCQDSSYCSDVAAEAERCPPPTQLRNKDGIWFWKKLIAAKFPSDSKQLLYFILDGVDEVNQEIGCEKFFNRDLIRALKQLGAEKLAVRFLVLGRPHWQKRLDNATLTYSTITVTKEKLVEDMRVFITAKLKTSSRLHKVRMPVKKRIKAVLTQKADSMIYLVHMLRRLGGFHHDKMILEELQNAPDSFPALLDRIESDIGSRRSAEQSQALQSAFAWLAFCKRPLTVAEVNAVAWVCGQYQAFSIEEEVSTRTGNFLEIEGAPDDGENGDRKDEEEDDESEDDTAIEVGTDDGSQSVLRIINRSIHEFLRGAQSDKSALRLPANDAHASIFETCVNLICNLDGQQQTPGGSALSKYAATWWGKHFQLLDIDLASDVLIRRTTVFLKHILENENHAATFIEMHCDTDGGVGFYMDSLGITQRKDNKFMLCLIPWLEKAAKLHDLDPEIRSWIEKSLKAPLRIFEPLAREHICNWLQDTDEERHSYDFAVDLLNLTDLAPNECIMGEGKLEPEFFSAVAAIPELPDTSSGLRAIAKLCELSDSITDAILFCQNSLDIVGDDDVEKLKSQVVFSNILGNCATQGAQLPVLHQMITTGRPNTSLDSDDEDEDDDAIVSEIDVYKLSNQQADITHLTKLPMEDKEIALIVRECWTTRAFCEMKLGNFDKAVECFDKSRAAWPEELMDGQSLSVLPTILLVAGGRDKEMIEKIEGWTVLERMSWLTVDFDEQYMKEDADETFRRAGRLANRDDFVVRVFEEIIAFLDTRKTAAMMRVKLAKFYIYSYHTKGGFPSPVLLP
ncbi:hypothetical protein G7Y89_g13844 [Cudoniella acicularis]|uniref:Fungal STAND N-terminal Goodbye domain-containing protein n=1 Tax=Cudoniella acicularis TaxID=354080 RepID=A0A8H4VVP1_9HELO|nr:hypothetical protein G7Y89_g13844 [Cudoniella acicularis]